MSTGNSSTYSETMVKEGKSIPYRICNISQSVFFVGLCLGSCLIIRMGEEDEEDKFIIKAGSS